MGPKQTLITLASRITSTELLLQLRWEMQLRARGLFSRFGRRQRSEISRLRAGARGLRVNLGCGPLPAPGWLNVDGAAAEADLIQDIGRQLDLPDGCARLIFSEHVLEHLQFPDQSRVFLSECRRVLEPGGYIRIIVPDAERVIRAYAAGDRDLLRAVAPSEATPIEAVNRIFRERGFHRFAWDFALLKTELERVGFANVRRARFRDSAVPDLNLDHDEPGRVAQSLYVEAIKNGNQQAERSA